MGYVAARIERLRFIVATLIREDITPKNARFASRVYKIAFGGQGVSRRTAREYAESLGVSWKRYRWTNWVRNNQYMSKEEREEWMKKHSKKLSSDMLGKMFGRVSEESE